jgi:hypothetical protein
MSTTEQEIERVLCAAPRPAPPAGLKEQLLAQVRLPCASTPALSPTAGERGSPGQSPCRTDASGHGEKLASVLPFPRRGGEGRGEGAGRGGQPAVVVTRRSPSSGWLRRWWPVLLPGSVSLACAVALTMQQMEIRNLRQAIQDLARESAAKARELPAPTPTTNGVSIGPEAAARTQQEVARLKGLAGQLTAEVAQLEQMRAENRRLRAQLAAGLAGSLGPEDADALAKAKERAESIACVNNLKQLGLAARLWAVDNGDMSPPNLLEMTNEMSTPKILVCPADHGREAAKNWASYTSANCSYEYLAPSAPDTEPMRVLFRCPIHGHVGLCDGSVQGELAKRHPERLVQRDGKLYQAEPAGVAPKESVQDAFRRRYGLDGPPNQVVPAQPTTNPPPGDPPPGGSDQ